MILEFGRCEGGWVVESHRSLWDFVRASAFYERRLLYIVFQKGTLQ